MSVEEAAPLLGMSQPSLYRHIKKLGLVPVATKPKRLYAGTDLATIQRNRRAASAEASGQTGRRGTAVPTPAPVPRGRAEAERDRLVRVLRRQNQELRDVIADLRMAVREAEAVKSFTAQSTTRQVGNLLDSIERLGRSNALDSEAFD